MNKPDESFLSHESFTAMPGPEGRRLNILLVEDAEDDVKLTLRALRRGGFDVAHRRVQCAADLQAALADERWDAVLSDFRMPGFTGLEALEIFRASGLDIPFILISGTVGEDTAVAAMKAGASDYIMKQSLARLVPALQRELKEAQARADMRQARAQASAEMQKLSHAIEQSPVSVVITDRQGTIEYVNPHACQSSGYRRDELVGQNPRLLQSGLTPLATYRELWQTILSGQDWRGELLNRRKSGELYWEREVISPIADADGEVSHFIEIKEDITERKRSDDELRRLNRMLALIGECSQVLIHAADEASLLEGVCRRIHASGDFVAVWAGLAGDDTARQVRPAAVVGSEDAALRAAIDNITWADTEYGRGPTGTAVRTRQALVMRDMDDVRLLPWRDMTTRLGIHSTASLPLVAGDAALGVISMYARTEEAFDDREVAMLRELADDLARGLLALRGAAERQRVEAQLLLSRHAIESSNDGIMITDSSLPDRPISYVNATFERITGYAAAEAVGRNARFLLGEDVEQIGLDELRAALREQRPAKVVLRNFRKNGSLFWNELSLAPVRDESGQARYFVSIINDVTERKRYETQLEHQANHDVLTGLANRNLLADRMQQAMTYARRANRLVAVILLDLDRFKVVNDSLGHDTGDALLKIVAERLGASVRPGDTVARLGGDEFVVVMADIAHENDVAPLMRAMLDLLARDICVAEHEMVATASVGVALYPRDGTETETLLKNADAAMYRAKELGRNSFQFYTPEMNARALQRLELEAGLRRALERQELVLFYQPKVELRSGQVVGAEALIRWRHPVLGMVSPADFIPLAEETGLIVPIGKWVIETACDQIKAWQNEGLAEIDVAVNLSARQFEQEDLSQVVAQALCRSGVEAHYLELEVTESAVMRDPERTVAVLRDLKQLGVRLSLDDFGTGYSSLNYLKRFPIDTLKIDQSFVRDITTNPDDAAIALAVISLAHSLKRRVVAEGVETEAQLNYLRRQRCDEMQGYYFSRPLPAGEFAALLRLGHSLPIAADGPSEAARTLLLVDDEPGVIAALRRVLRREGYRLLTAASAAEGLELLALNDVQVIVSDQRMPEMNGTEFLGRVKEMHPDTIRIVLTGYTELKSVTDAVNRGAIYKFLTKPWDDDLLREHIREAFFHFEARKGGGQ